MSQTAPTVLRLRVRSASTDEVYRCEAIRTREGVRFTCTCPAGEFGSHCKHRIDLVMGDLTNVVSDGDGLNELALMVRGSALEQAVVEMFELDRQVDALKRRLAMQKKVIARLMAG